MQKAEPTWADIYAERFEAAFKKTARYFMNSAVVGWQYTQVLEEPFIDPTLEPIVPPKKLKKKPIKPLQLPKSKFSAAIYLQKIANILDMEQRWIYINELVTTENKLLLADDFIDVKDSDLGAALREAVSEERLNVIIIGAGCVGLALANMLKTSLGDDINILVVEKRVQTRHVKKPYSRNWLTSTSRSRLNVMDPRLMQIAKMFGQDHFMGLTVKAFETLLLLSCRDLGVKFLYDDAYDLSFVEGSKTHLVFDTTGGRLGDIPGLTQKENMVAHDEGQINVGIPEMKDFASNNHEFGVIAPPVVPAQTIVLKARKGTYYPHVDGRQIKTALVKIVNIPMEYYQPLLEFVQSCNDDNLIYLWPGTLRPKLNHFLIFVNLLKPSYKDLSAFIEEPMSLTSFIERGGFDIPTLDPRVVDLIEVLESKGGNLDDFEIEPPFLYVPYVHNIGHRLQRLHGRPVMPLGDSSYNGNPKAGNGLGPQLKYMQDLRKYVVQLHKKLRSR